MDCIIRVINGPDTGLTQKVEPGATVVGRGNRAGVRLTPEDISWEHAVITREGDDYFVENLSAQGTWVGDGKITGRVRIRPRDKVRLSRETVLRLERAEGGGLLASRGFLAAALLMMIAVLVGVAFYQSGDDEAASGSGDDWNNAYFQLSAWLKKQADKGKIGHEVVPLFADAWRLEQAQDYINSKKQWIRLQVMLNASQNLKSAELAEKDKTDQSLGKLLRPTRPDFTPSDDEAAAAFAQFVRRRLDWSIQQTKKKSMFST